METIFTVIEWGGVIFMLAVTVFVVRLNTRLLWDAVKNLFKPDSPAIEIDYHSFESGFIWAMHMISERPNEKAKHKGKPKHTITTVDGEHLEVIEETPDQGNRS